MKVHTHNTWFCSYLHPPLLGLFTIHDIEWALKLKYQILCIYKAFLFTDLKQLFSDFLGVLASQKIRSEHVPESYADNMEAMADYINTEMQFHDPSTRLEPSSFKENAGLRKASKGDYQ